MIVVFYHADAHHPCSYKPSIYYQMVARLIESANQFGYGVIHLTDEKNAAMTVPCLRYPVQAREVMLSRERAFYWFLEKSCDDSQQYMLVEPDSIFVKAVPPLPEGKDFMLLRRPGDNYPPGVRLCRRSALPFYQEVLHYYEQHVSPSRRDWHGDVDAMHMALGNWPEKDAVNPPTSWRGLGIDVREYRDYVSSRQHKGSVMLHWKGASKQALQ